MKTTAAILLATAPLLHAGSPAPAAAEADPWIKPTIDIRTRYEFADIDGTDEAHAWTFRERLGLKTMAWHGLSGVVEGEFSQAAVDNYHGGAPGADPFDPDESLIADPETNELNQGYLQYEGFDTTGRIGRQRIIYDNAAFIGNVGWRQNEQTYDAIALTNQSLNALTLRYAYLNQINRIYGSDADEAVSGSFTNVQDLASSCHLFNASYTGIKGLTLGGYAYVMNFDKVGTWDNNTFGVSAKGDWLGLTLYGELAWQDKAGLDSDEEALYAHITASTKLGHDKWQFGTLTLGIEHLDAGFKTPLATVHAFNGFADVTDAGRISGAQNGLTDAYVCLTTPLYWGIDWSNYLHAMGDNELSAGYGWEYDSVLSKKFAEHFLALAKFACFQSEGDAYTGDVDLPDAIRASIELNYTF